MKKLFILFFLIIFLVACSPNLVTSETFAQCLTGKGVAMYGTEWCGHCQNQKALFGDSFQYINFVDCDQNRAACIDARIPGYPTWIINGEQYAGEQSFAELAQATGCEI